MARVTEETTLGLTVIFDDEKGWYIEGHVPWVPGDPTPEGWVCFELPVRTTKEQVAMEMLKLGYHLDEVHKILEEF